MPLVTTTKMFKDAYEGGYAVGAFNVNNMEIIQGIVQQERSSTLPLFSRFPRVPVLMQITSIL